MPFQAPLQLRLYGENWSHWENWLKKSKKEERERKKPFNMFKLLQFLCIFLDNPDDDYAQFLCCSSGLSFTSIMNAGQPAAVIWVSNLMDKWKQMPFNWPVEWSNWLARNTSIRRMGRNYPFAMRAECSKSARANEVQTKLACSRDDIWVYWSPTGLFCFKLIEKTRENRWSREKCR